MLFDTLFFPRTILVVIFAAQAIYANTKTGLAQRFHNPPIRVRLGVDCFLFTYAFGCELEGHWSGELGCGRKVWLDPDEQRATHDCGTNTVERFSWDSCRTKPVRIKHPQHV
jgi:hypothetical protein